MLRNKMSLCLIVLALAAVPALEAAHHEGGMEALAKAWESAYNSGDFKAVAAMYLEDGMRMPADQPTVTGREAILGQLEAGVGMGLAKVKIEVVDAKMMGEMGVGRGTFQGMDAEGNTITQGKWANVVKMVDGKWMIHYDIFNYDAPMTAPE